MEGDLSPGVAQGEIDERVYRLARDLGLQRDASAGSRVPDLGTGQSIPTGDCEILSDFEMERLVIGQTEPRNGRCIYLIGVPAKGRHCLTARVSLRRIEAGSRTEHGYASGLQTVRGSLSRPVKVLQRRELLSKERGAGIETGLLR